MLAPISGPHPSPAASPDDGEAAGDGCGGIQNQNNRNTVRLPLKRQSHTDPYFMSLRCLSRISTCASHALHTQYCDRTTVHTAHARLLTARWSVSGDSLLPICSPPSPTSMSPGLVHICIMSPALGARQPAPGSALGGATPHEREVVGRWVAPVARSARYGARASGVFRRAGCCSRPAAARRARRGVWPPCPACSRDPSMRSSARSPPRSRRSPPRSPRRRPPQMQSRPS